jgi:hypothetical protein
VRVHSDGEHELELQKKFHALEYVMNMLAAEGYGPA